ncbi:MAG: hypothetical protein DWQ37_01600 [Planctomycetota bacterium]|nr:MAG: hypothetical protein DWQ37_01600 [Planctomycetota bacterium]
MPRIALFALLAMLACVLVQDARGQDEAHLPGDPAGSTDWLNSVPSSPGGGWNGAAVTDNRATCIGPFDWIGRCCPPLLYRTPLETTYVTVDAVAFRRDWASNQWMATVGDPTTIALTTHDLEIVHQPGMRVVVGRWLDECSAVEASFLGLLRWDQRSAVQNEDTNALGTAGDLFSPFTYFGDPAEVGFDYNYYASIRLVSDFNNAELNLRHRMAMPPSCVSATALVGFRYINIDEQFSYLTESLEPVADGSLDTANVSTSNSLYGFQAGFSISMQFEPRFWIDLEAKFLLMRNGARQRSVYEFGPLAGPVASTITGSRSQGRATLGTDLAITGQWQCTPHIIFRFGYQGIFLDGLALAAENFTRNAPLMPMMVNDPTELDYEGHLAFHGPFGGVTVTW